MQKKNVKIMLIEDDLTQSIMYETVFEHFGYSLIVVNLGREAMKAIRKNKPELILLDLLLGEVSGLDILDEIKADPKLKDIKVVVISNFTKKGLVEECLEKGALEFIVKSKLIPREVVRITERYLSGSQENKKTTNN